MVTQPVDREQAVAQGVACGIKAETAAAVVDAYRRVSTTNGRRYDPSTWSRTVWLAEADRWVRTGDAEAHLTLVLHLERLRGDWEAKATAGARGWVAGTVGERLSKR